MSQLIVLDVDGTLVGSEGLVAECVWQAAERAQAAGIKLAVCTGRPGAGIALQIARRLGPRNAHVFQSGAVIAEPNGDTLHVAGLREASVLELVEHARDLSFTLELYTPTTLYVERRTALSEAHAKMIGVTALVRDLQEVARVEPVVRAQWVVDLPDRPTVEGLKVEGSQISSATSPALPNSAFVSVTRSGVTKGSAVRLLAENLGVDLQDVIAVGDSEGDVPMLEVVGTPLLMPEAPPELRERFPNLSKGVDECGVVEAFEQALAPRHS